MGAYALFNEKLNLKESPDLVFMWRLFTEWQKTEGQTVVC
jgi:hypothetical protein